MANMGNRSADTKFRRPSEPRSPIGPSSARLCTSAINANGRRAGNSAFRRDRPPQEASQIPFRSILGRLAAIEGPWFGTYSDQFWTELIVLLGRQPTEKLIQINCDEDCNYLSDEEIGVGTAGSIAAKYRSLAESALAAGASNIILVHNHPSGNVQPSEADITATARLIDILQPFQIRIHDHLIVTHSEGFSMRQAGAIQ